MSEGKIIYLNGTSSAGKTSIAKELQRVMEELYLYASIDLFVTSTTPVAHPSLLP